MCLLYLIVYFHSHLLCLVKRFSVGCVRQVSPSMRSSELAETALKMRSVTYGADDFWTTFEVIENGELGIQSTEQPGNTIQTVMSEFSSNPKSINLLNDPKSQDYFLFFSFNFFLTLTSQ